MVLETSWGTRTGWIIVRDVLLHRPLAPRRRALAHPPPRADRLRRRPRPAAHDALRQRRGRDARWTASRCSTTAASAAQWEYAGRGYGEAVAPRRGRATLELTPDHRPAPRLRGRARARARTTLREGDTAFVALSWTEHAPPETYDEAYQRLVVHRRLLAALARATATFPDHPWRTLPAAQRADAQGPDLRADRRDDRRGDDVAARDARRRAQLGLPLHAGSATRPSCSGASTRSGFDWEANDFFYFIADVAEGDDDAADHVRHRRRARRSTSRCSTTSPATSGARPVRIGNGAYDQKPARRLGRAARLDLPAHAARATSCAERVWPILERQVEDGDRRTGASPTAASGRSAASRSTSPRRR